MVNIKVVPQTCYHHYQLFWVWMWPKQFQDQKDYFKLVCCLPSGIAYSTIGCEGRMKGKSHLKYPFLSSCNTSPRWRFRMLESPYAKVSFLVHGLSTSMKSSSSSCNQRITQSITISNTNLLITLIANKLGRC